MQRRPDSPGVRLVARSMHAVFVIGAFLVGIAGVQLFILPLATDHWFAWTIQVPLSAASLGAFYWTALAVAAQSARRTAWAEVRVGIPGVLVFVSLTFAATLLHADKFHFTSADDVARGAAYLWLVIYLVDPLFVAVAWLLQARAPGVDPPRTHVIPAWYRLALVVQAAALVPLGVALFVSPAITASVWPWLLTPLTSRAIGAWLVGIGMIVGQAAWERAWERIEVATLSYAVLGLLQLVALVRFNDDVIWSRPASVAYPVVLGGIVVFGLAGYWLGLQATRRASPTRPVTP